MTVFWDDSPDDRPDGDVGGTIEGPGTSGARQMANPWDTCMLKGEPVPGIVAVSVSNKERRVQKGTQLGSDGATPIFRGLKPAKVTIRVTIWTPEQFTLWEALLPVIFPNPNKNVDQLASFDISSPATQNRGVKAIIVEDIDGPNDSQVKGAKEWVLRCVEYIPVVANKSATATVTGAVATTQSFAPGSSKNNPAPPSATDFGPTTPAQAQQGGT